MPVNFPGQIYSRNLHSDSWSGASLTEYVHPSEAYLHNGKIGSILGFNAFSVFEASVAH